MARYTQRPENALKRANEFIEVGKPLRALDTLQEVFRNKRWNYAYSETVIEPLMFKYLYLCVELKKSHIAKEGLFQYRNMFQLVNVNSLENVIRGYLKMAEEHTEAAQAQSSAAVAVLELDDLDNIATPESILMSAVCGEDAQDRSDRTILLPWVKFLWESYCQCLELLRVNTHCEALYHDIARMAFQFCLKYNRKSEFRRLCDKLRKHLEDICKSSNQTTGVSINKVETQQLCLDTRLYLLDSAIQMELWQEAYKAIEDIHGLMALSKKTPVPKTMANYYQKLAMVFSKAGNQLFHAAALLKLFQLTRELKKNLTKDDLQRMAAHVLLATLSIPLPSAHPEFDRFIEADKSPLEKAQKLAVLLGLPQPPTRVSLIREVVRLNVPQLVSEDFRNLYNWLEVDFNPLNLCKRIQSIVDIIETGPTETNLLSPYIQSLKDVTIMRLIRQISQVYESIEFKRLLELATFCNIFELEKLLVESVRHNDMQIRIDHQKNSIYFGTDLTESQREYRPDGPALQSMPSEQIRSQLVNMSTVLTRAVSIVYPNRERDQRAKLRTQMVHHYHEIKDREHQRILQRQKIIEDRKEYIEKQNNAREEEEARRQEEESRKAKLAEQKRLELEQEERERKRHQNEIQAIKEKSLKEKVQQISQTAHGKKMLSKLDEEGIKKLDAEQIAKRESEELQREAKELQSKLKSQEKKIDYYERAKRLEEIPLFEKYLAEKQVKDKEFWEATEKTRIENAIAERKDAVSQQERLKRMYPDRDEFLEALKKERASLYVEKLKKFEIALEAERKKRLADRVIRRREERRQAFLREKEEERLRKEEEIRLAQAAEERAAAEARRLEREAEDEKRRAQYEKQRAKEEEAERKIKEDRDRLAREVAVERERSDKERDTWRPRGGDRPSAASAGGGGGAGEWRRAAAPIGDRNERAGDRIERGGERMERGGDRMERGGDRMERGGERTERGGDRMDRGGERMDRGGERGERGADRDRERRDNEGADSSWRVRREPDSQRGAGVKDVSGSAAPPSRDDKWRRGGDRDRDRDRDFRNDGPRRDRDDRDDRDRGGFRRNDGPRRNDDAAPRETGGNWRDAPRQSDRDNRRPAGDRRDREVRGGDLRGPESRAPKEGGPSGGTGTAAGGGGNWRTAPGPRDEPAPKRDQPQDKENKAVDDGEWTSVKRR
ncbi:eukaryotic translation initiation factor 3 subunit A [Drosophila pseudoobscura]|uniref:Eukaryotic translation initiation factor 3 subunit A n=1 Tax=Drosophila pseudoobscura pseudoobscura TaxID=46245 RepID=A0A6I8UR72_DROPS|nr:eukaryotic translation initiation factor 3 subunit A [Drosophila pseudoobscura]